MGIQWIFVFAVALASRANGSPANSDDGCRQCQMMVQAVIQIFPSDRTGQINLVTCKRIPAMNEELCSSLRDMSKTEICQSLGQCMPRISTSENGHVFSSEIEIQDDLEVTGLPCMLCENIMKIAHSFLESAKHRSYLLKLLKSACHFIPFLRKECEHMVEHFGQLVLQIVSNYLSPTLCKTFHICPAGEAAAYRDDCRLCQFGMGVVTDTLEDPDLETRFRGLARQLCVDVTGDDTTCEAMAQELTQSFLPVAEEFGHSDFFSNVCQNAEICPQA